MPPHPAPLPEGEGVGGVGCAPNRKGGRCASSSLVCSELSSPAVLPLRRRPPEKTPSIAERTKDLKRYEGFQPFFWDAKKGQLLLDVSRFERGVPLRGGAGGRRRDARGLARPRAARGAAPVPVRARGAPRPAPPEADGEPQRRVGPGAHARRRGVLPLGGAGVACRSSRRRETACSWTRRLFSSMTRTSCRP